MGRKFIILFVFLFFYSPIVNAACSLGANPLSMEASARPGDEIEVTWNFYNLYGDRLTHVVVNKIKGPDWKIRYDPELREQNYEVSGVIEKIRENIAVEKSPIVLEIPESPPEGIDYVKHPNEEGYIPVRPLKIYLSIPDDADLWEEYDFVFEAKGSCVSEPGAVIPGMAIQLSLNVKTTAEFYEKPVKDNLEGKEKYEKENKRDVKRIPARITGGVAGAEETISPAAGLLISTSILLLILLIFLVKIKLNKK